MTDSFNYIIPFWDNYRLTGGIQPINYNSWYGLIFNSELNNTSSYLSYNKPYRQYLQNPIFSVSDRMTFYNGMFLSELSYPSKKKHKSKKTVKPKVEPHAVKTASKKNSVSKTPENKTSYIVKGDFTQKFINRVKKIAEKINLDDYHDLLALINAESGFSTTVRSGGKANGAVGLIQFTDIAIRELNQVYGLSLTKNKIAAMSAMEQLDLVEKYLVRAKSYKFKQNEKLTGSDLYAIVYMPANAKSNIVAAQKDGKNYRSNIGLDMNKDGQITYDELGKQLKKFAVSDANLEKRIKSLSSENINYTA